MLAATALFLILLLFPSSGLSETPRERYQKIQKDIKVHKQKLSSAKKREHSVLDEIDKIERELNTITSEIREQKREIKKITGRANETKKELKNISQSLETQKVLLRKKLRAMQLYDYTTNRLLVLLHTDDFFDLLRLNRYLTMISRYDNKQIVKFKDLSASLHKKNEEYNSLISELKKRKTALNAAGKKLQAKKQEKRDLLFSVKKEQVLYASVIKELEDTSQRLKSLLDKKVKETTFRGKGFYRMRGRLPWPVNGRLAIPYGSHKDPRFQTPVFRNGVYISTREDEDVKAIHGGRVVFADWFKGLGQVVIINHGMGYHSVYANLSSIFSRLGAIIRDEAILGKAGTSGIIDGHGIYFEVRYKGKPTNPLRWLKKK